MQASSLLDFAGSGTLGPDITLGPLGALSGQTFSFTGTIPESLSPVACTNGVTATVCYSIPAGDLSGSLGTRPPFTTTTTSILGVTLPSSGPDILEIEFSFEGLATVYATMDLDAGSFNNGVKTDPEPFTPSPQNLTAATSLTSGGSTVEYCILGLCLAGDEGLTGLSGSVSSSTVAPVPEPATLGLLGFGLAAVILYRRRKA